jgi:N-ethylmaleimide reductase
MRQGSRLFSSVRLGPLELPNRIVMSPMTRIRADENCVPTERTTLR